MQDIKRLVILGCGYVGQRVAQRWLEAGFQVTVTTTTPEKVPQLEPIASTVTVVRGDDPDRMQQLLADQDGVLVSIGAPNRQEYRGTYLATAQTLAQVLPHTAIQQVIYTGSFAVYGNHGGHWVTEETAIAPTTDNNQILADTEQCLLQMARPDRSVCILRLGGIYGPNRELLKIFRRVAGATLDGDGHQPSNWVHIDDIVGAIAFAQQHQLSGIYNLVQDTIISRRELLERVCQTYNLPPVQWNPVVPSNRPHNVKVSNQKIKTAGYRLIHPDFWLPIPSDA
ncbi:MAG: SDR family oxidoreductase [Cyanothece sp. SIO2G6]|nr:SDR family oxidoreductase [Cyanothece sp. SIO2G6]